MCWPQCFAGSIGVNFLGFLWVFHAHMAHMHQCEGTNTHVEPFFLAFTATSSHLPLHETLEQFFESSLRQAEQKHGNLRRKKRKWPQHTIRPHLQTFKNGFPTPKIGGAGVPNPPKT